MTTWTIKSPWRIVEHNWEDTSIYDAEDDVICTITISADVTEETQPHYEQIVAEKARAIASLPDLIKAAKELSDANEALTNAIDKMVEWEEPIAEQARLALAWRALRSALPERRR